MRGNRECRSKLFLSLTIVAVTLAATTLAAQNPRTQSSPFEIRSSEADRPLRWRLEELWRVTAETPGIGLFTTLHPDQITVDDMGRVFLLNSGDRTVTVISPNGTVAGRWGRNGAGPGEINDPMTLALRPDGGIAVYDIAKSGLVEWRPDGSVAPERPLMTPRFVGPRLRFAHDDAVFFTTSSRDQQGARRQRLVRLMGKEVSTLAELTPVAGRRTDFPSCGLISVTVSPLFAPSLIWDARAGQVAAAQGGEYRIQRYGSTGPVATIVRPLPQRRVTNELARREATGNITSGSCTVPPDEVVRGSGYVDFIPAIAALTLTPRGELWVQRGQVRDEPGVVDVFAPSGQYLGTLSGGSPFPVIFAGEDIAVTLTRDEDDLPIVTMVRVIRQ